MTEPTQVAVAVSAFFAVMVTIFTGLVVIGGSKREREMFKQAARRYQEEQDNASNAARG